MSDKEVKNNESQDKPEQDGDAKPAENGETEEKADQRPKGVRAVVLTSFGGLKSVKVQQKPLPALGKGEVLIRVKASGLNFQDLMIRQGVVDYVPKTPFILGLECSGDVEEVGEGVEDFKVGDRVVALPEYGAWAEQVIVPGKFVYKIPDNMSYQDAAAMAVNFIVAYILVFELGNISPGKKILLHSAGGGVGQAIIQLCRTVKDVEIFGVASKGKHESLKDSVDHLLERGSDYTGEIEKLSPDGVDVVFDCVCGGECFRGYNLLRPMGRYILFGSSSNITGETKSLLISVKEWWYVDKLSPLKLFNENRTLGGFNLRHLMNQEYGVAHVRKTINKVFDLWKENKIKPVIDSTWAWEDIPEAMQKLHDRKNVGKIVLDPAQAPKPKPATPVKGKKGNSIDKETKNKEDESVNGVTEEAQPQQQQPAQEPEAESKETSSS